MTRMSFPAAFVAALLASGTLPQPVMAQAGDAASADVGAQFCQAIARPCIAAGRFAVVEPSEGDDGLLDALPIAAGLFDAYFDMAAPLSVVWRIDPSNSDPAVFATEMDQAGYGDAVLLPWPSAAAEAEMFRAQMMEQVRADFPEMSDEDLAQMMDNAFVTMGGGGPEDGMAPDTEFGIERHEMGHIWLTQKFLNPAADQDGHDQDAYGQDAGHDGGPADMDVHIYGSYLPDWVDEMAAVMMETEIQKRGRWNEVRQLGAQNLVPLADFFAMEHPALDAIRVDVGNGDIPSSGFRIVMSEDAMNGAVDPAMVFYSQALMVSQYFQSRSGSNQVLIPLIGHVRDGGTVADWLATQSDYPALPRTMDALETDWQAWVAERLATMPSS